MSFFAKAELIEGINKKYLKLFTLLLVLIWNLKLLKFFVENLYHEYQN